MKINSDFFPILLGAVSTLGLVAVAFDDGVVDTDLMADLIRTFLLLKIFNDILFSFQLYK